MLFISSRVPCSCGYINLIGGEEHMTNGKWQMIVRKQLISVMQRIFPKRVLLPISHGESFDASGWENILHCNLQHQADSMKRGSITEASTNIVYGLYSRHWQLGPMALCHATQRDSRLGPARKYVFIHTHKLKASARTWASSTPSPTSLENWTLPRGERRNTRGCNKTCTLFSCLLTFNTEYTILNSAPQTQNADHTAAS